MVPFHHTRLDDSLPPKVTGLFRTISEIYKNNVWVTPNGWFDLPSFRIHLQGIRSRPNYWSGDYPYYPMDGTRECLKTRSINEGDREKIAHANAESLQGLRIAFKISQERPENWRARPQTMPVRGWSANSRYFIVSTNVLAIQRQWRAGAIVVRMASMTCAL
jgi:hypothetical protein